MGYRPGLLRNTQAWTISAAFAFVILSAFFVAYLYVGIMENGGNRWATGDWLINYRGGLVRRGLTGTLILDLVDWTGFDPISILVALQLAIWLSVTAAVVYCFTTAPMSGPVLMLLISPMFMQLPFFYPGNAMMKEIVAFLGFALMAAAAPSRRPGFFWAGCVFFGLSGFGNEANALLLPAVLVFIWLYVSNGLISKPQAVIAASSVTIAAVAALGIATIYSGKGLSAQMCNDLANYVDPSRFCAEYGAIWWLERDTAFGIETMWNINIGSSAWPKFVLGYGAALLPFFFFRPTQDPSGVRTALAYAGVVFGILFLSPLFVVATDWGRWINMHVFALTMLAVAALTLNVIQPRIRSVSPLFLVYGACWAMPEWGRARFTLGLLERASHVVRWLVSSIGS